MPSIKIKNNDETISVIELTEDNYSIGRNDSNDITLADARSSRQHARIFREDSDLFLEDIGSANGTLINNNRINSKTPYRLADNDIITIGSTELIITGIAINNNQGLSSPEFHAYSGDSLLFDSVDSDYELSATLDASISLAQLSEEDSFDSSSMTKALKRMEAMCIISEAIGNIMDTSRLTDTVIDTVFGIFPKAERAFILLKESDRFLPAAARSRSNQDLKLDDLKISTTVLKNCTEKKISILSNNTSEDERFNEAMSIAELAIESFICSPLIINNEVLGVIQVECSGCSDEFDQTDLQIITGISSQIAIAVKNISLAQEIERETAQRANLQRYFSPNMVDMLINGDVNTELGGKEYTGTVFFSDIIGFTAMSEKMKAVEVVNNLNKYFTIMQNLIYQNNGNVDKFGGDAIMAFWSVPQRHNDDEYQAVLTGIQMQTSLYPFNIELKHDMAETIYMGIGINTGNFVAGNIGSEDKIEFTLIGDNVNLAARIEARAGKTQVMCSNDTFTRIAEKVSGVTLPDVSFKGKSTPQQIFSIRAIETRPGRMSTCIPVRTVTGENTLSDDFYMLSELISTQTESSVIILSDNEFSTSDEIKFKCCLNEYHECIEFTGHISDKLDKTSLSGHKYFEYSIIITDSSRFLEIFSPGFKYHTELSWEEMPREKEIEGN